MTKKRMTVNVASVPTKLEVCDFDWDNHGDVILGIRED